MQARHDLQARRASEWVLRGCGSVGDITINGPGKPLACVASSYRIAPLEPRVRIEMSRRWIVRLKLEVIPRHDLDPRDFCLSSGFISTSVVGHGRSHVDQRIRFERSLFWPRRGNQVDQASR